MSIIWEAYRQLFRPKSTEKYPFGNREEVSLPDGFRGKMILNRESCIGCTLCEKDCPSGAIVIIVDAKGKRPTFFLDRCMFCGQCQESCPKKCISYSKEFENAAYDRKSLEVR
ncbi:MAG: 4Fe-4S binding protein [Candidatus Methanomethylicus sp.]|nr:4Fe-4S binding protein [Candidatus Methanomethylicus sp.]